MTESENNTPSQSAPKRLWLLGAVLVAVALAAYLSEQRRDRLSTETVTLGDGRPKLLEFGMGVCAQCKRMKPVMARAEKELEDRVDVRILDIRYEPNELLADRFDLRTMPLIVLVDGKGEELWRHDGYVAYDALARAVRDRLGTGEAR